MQSWFPDVDIREIADYDQMNNLGIFDITVNGVLVHSRRCDTRTYGVPGHLWLRDEPRRQQAVWYAIDSARAADKGQRPQGRTARHPRVVVRSSSCGARHAARAAELIESWFQHRGLEVETVIDDSSEWNFEILVDRVLLHSRSTQWHGFFHDEWCQQSLLWRAISDRLPDASTSTVMGA